VKQKLMELEKCS